MLLEKESYEDGSKILAESLGTNIPNLAGVNDNVHTLTNKDQENTNLNTTNTINRGENMANAQIKETQEVRNFNFKPVKKIEANTKTNKNTRKKIVQFNKAFNTNNTYDSHIENDESHRNHLNLVDSEEDYRSTTQTNHVETLETASHDSSKVNTIKTIAPQTTKSVQTSQDKKEVLNNSIDVAKTSGLFVKNVSVGTAKIYTSFLMTMLSSILFMVQNISPILQGTFNLALPAFATWLISTKVGHVATMMHTFAPEAKLLCYASFYFGSFFAWVTACLILTNLLNGIGLGMKKLAQVGAQTK